jgi:hypothetical protein
MPDCIVSYRAQTLHHDDDCKLMDGVWRNELDSTPVVSMKRAPDEQPGAEYSNCVCAAVVVRLILRIVAGILTVGSPATAPGRGAPPRGPS